MGWCKKIEFDGELLVRVECIIYVKWNVVKRFLVVDKRYKVIKIFFKERVVNRL